MLLNKIRQLVQAKMNEIDGIGAGAIKDSSMVEEGVYYFGYDVRTSLDAFNIDYSNQKYSISLVGYFSTKGGTLAKFDEYMDAICDQLISLNFRPTTQDAPIADKPTVRRCMVTAYVELNTLDKFLR